VNKLLTYTITLDSLIVAYIQFVIMLIEWQKVKLGTKVFVEQDYHSPIGMNRACESSIYKCKYTQKIHTLHYLG